MPLLPIPTTAGGGVGDRTGVPGSLGEPEPFATFSSKCFRLDHGISSRGPSISYSNKQTNIGFPALKKRCESGASLRSEIDMAGRVKADEQDVRQRPT